MGSTDQSDRMLIERYNAGDKSALAQLVKRWHKTFCQKAFWVLRDRDLSKDVAQECWIIIINKLNTLRNTDNFEGWALRIIYTKSINAHNRRIKQSRELDKVDSSVYSDTNDEEGRTELHNKLLDAIQGLSEDKQDIIRLFYVEQYPIKEISVFLQIPIGTVKSRLFKAREKLKSLVNDTDSRAGPES